MSKDMTNVNIHGAFFSLFTIGVCKGFVEVFGVVNVEVTAQINRSKFE